MDEYGLIGYPLGHSFSPAFFAEKFSREEIDACYDAFPLAHIEDFPALIKDRPQLRGLNVTIPHKEGIIPFLDELHSDAAAIGAVNCIRIEGGKATGYNTDWLGFRDSLRPLLKPHHTRAIILGTGGASKAVAYTLQQLGIAFSFVSRGQSGIAFSYEELTPEIMVAHTLVVNTTPLGMHPHEDTLPPLPYSALGPQHLLYDLIYNPAQTRFLLEGATRGATIKNGREMLELQAEASWRLWKPGND